MSELRRLMMAKKIHTSPLPSGYTECEYLESANTQYIDIPQVPTVNSIITARMAITVDTENYFNISGFALASNAGWVCFGRYSINKLVAYFSKGTRGGVEIDTDTNFHDYYISNGLQKIDSNESHSSVSSLSFRNIRLFKSQITWSGASTQGRQKISSFTMTDASNGYKIDLVPALDPNSRPCMFDIVSQTPLYNQGTGEFLYKLK